jgi:hypothetical protein
MGLDEASELALHITVAQVIIIGTLALSRTQRHLVMSRIWRWPQFSIRCLLITFYWKDGVEYDEAVGRADDVLMLMSGLVYWPQRFLIWLRTGRMRICEFQWPVHDTPALNIWQLQIFEDTKTTA